jgi:hypothetical protein
VTETNTKSSRRDFLMTGGAALGASAGIATTVGAATPLVTRPVAATPPGVAPAPVSPPDEHAKQLRGLHLDFTTLVENQSYEAVADLFDEQAYLDLSGVTANGKAAIRQLFVEQYRHQNAQVLHRAYRQNSSQQNDVVTLSEDGLQAAATFHVEVEWCQPLQGDSTVEQMARLQGNVADRRWETGRFDAKYVRTRGQWRIASLRYLSALAA